MTIQNIPKALIVLIGLACITLLMIFDKIEQSAGTGLIGSIIGYGIGNGINAGRAVDPIIGKKSNGE